METDETSDHVPHTRVSVARFLWQIVADKSVSPIKKVVVLLVLLYLPFPYDGDFVPIIGMADDWALLFFVGLPLFLSVIRDSVHQSDSGLQVDSHET